ncbi:MAG: polysaccharide biosynthesis C-terminal domain-containing protein [Campylobacterales bacterium]
MIESLFTSEYIRSSSILVIHIWALVFVFLGLSSTKWMISENLQIYSTINTTIGAIINIMLNYYLIDYMGIEGAAWATLISYFFASYFCLLFWKKTRVNFINISLSLFLPFDYLRQNFLLRIRK